MKKGLVGVVIKDKINNCESLEVDIEEFIFNPYDIEFRFPGYTDEYIDEPYEATCSYKDFLFFIDDYDVIIKIHDKE